MLIRPQSSGFDKLGVHIYSDPLQEMIRKLIWDCDNSSLVIFLAAKKKNKVKFCNGKADLELPPLFSAPVAPVGRCLHASDWLQRSQVLHLIAAAMQTMTSRGALERRGI